MTSMSQAEFKHAIYDLWAKHIGIAHETIIVGGNLITPLDKLKNTNMVQLFKLDRFSYFRCDPNLVDMLSHTIAAVVKQDNQVGELSREKLQAEWHDKQLEQDHVERVFYLYPDDFTPSENTNFPIRRLSEDDTDQVETLKAACTKEEFEDSWVSAEDELALGAFDNNQLIACASMYTLWGFADPGILVHPDYRGSGIGKALVSNICAQVLQDKRVMDYRCTTDHSVSARLAQALGFKQHFEIEVFKVTGI